MKTTLKRTVILVVLLLFTLSTLLSSASATVTAEPKESYRMLFIGNSLTVDVPPILKTICAMYGVEIDYTPLIIYGNLSQMKDAALNAMNEDSYDYVVIQEYAGVCPGAEMLEELCGAAKACGAKPVLYRAVGPAFYDPNYHFVEQDWTTKFLAAAELHDAAFVNAGGAIAYSYIKIPGLYLYPEDNIHTNNNGDYLIACVFASTLFDLHIKDISTPVHTSNDELSLRLGQSAWEFVSYFKEHQELLESVITVPDGANIRVYVKPSITTTSLRGGYTNSLYNQTLTSSGDKATWSIDSAVSYTHLRRRRWRCNN